MSADRAKNDEIKKDIMKKQGGKKRIVEIIKEL